MARVRDTRDGRDYEAGFDRRMTGRGPWADLLRQRFQRCCARLGYGQERVAMDLSRFDPGALRGQASLW
jgi:hypothetical protein